MNGKDLISIDDLEKKDILQILKITKQLEKKSSTTLLTGKVMASLFFEPSTRTRLSFESAMNQLGGRVIGFNDAEQTSTKKGESLTDTIKIVEQYADIIVIRHPNSGSARLASKTAKIPVINAGDGPNQHPTQTLLDLYTIQKSQKKLTGLKIAMVGDLKYGRTVHSLAAALSHFNAHFYFVSPSNLKMPTYIKDRLNKKSYEEVEDIMEVINDVDILYLTRIQKERFPDERDYEKVKNAYILTVDMLKSVKKNLKVMHPLPRVNEIDNKVDATPYADYFNQAANGIPVRKAILAMLLKKIK